MKIFLDFDDVIFNTKEFIADYKKIFLKHGISEKFFLESGSNIKIITGKKDIYDPKIHLEIIEKTEGKKLPRLKKDIINFLEKSDHYVFPDVADFLSHFRKKELYLVSYGDKQFQKAKVIGSGIQQFFQKILITDKMKSVEIGKLDGKNKKGEKLYFIDDRVEQIDAVKKNLPDIITFQMRRSEGRYRDKKTKYVNHAVKDFKKVVEIIKNYGV